MLTPTAPIVAAAEETELERFRAGKPGVYTEIPFPDYLRLPLLSQSVLKQGRNSMKHLKAALDREHLKKPTDRMMLGSALHTCFLEPEQMPERVIKWDGDARRGKEWDAFKQAHASKIILTPGMHEKLIGMVTALRKHPEVRRWVSKIDAVEVAAIGNVQDVPMKGRCDALTPDPLFDLKMVASADMGAVTRTALNFGYDTQAHIYRELFDRDRFILLVVEDAPPHDVVPHEFSPAFLRIGKQKATEMLDRYKFCLRNNCFPGRSDSIVQLEPPEWAAAGTLITIGGEGAFDEE